MSQYKITIEGPNRRVIVECDSRYTLDVDLVEWVRTEIDPNATFIFADKELAESPLNAEYSPADGPTMVQICTACVTDNHDECIDPSRISRVPFACICAQYRHQISLEYHEERQQ